MRSDITWLAVSYKEKQIKIRVRPYYLSQGLSKGLQNLDCEAVDGVKPRNLYKLGLLQAGTEWDSNVIG